MAPRGWTAQQLERRSPAEQDAIFESSIVTDLDTVPAAFLDRVTTRLNLRIAQRDLPKAQ